jgi:sec-independent protein translocase protein TatC
MASAVGRLGREDRLTVVGHLHELRIRLFICLAALAVAFGFCMWQNHALLRVINAPLAHQTSQQVARGRGPLGATYSVQQDTRAVAVQLQSVVSTLRRPDSGVSAATRGALAQVQPVLAGDIRQLSRPAEGDLPVTLGIGEPFTTTITVALLFALILALPVILYELYGFLVPALTAEQQRAATPMLFAVPALFATGVTFGYLVVLPAAVHFLQNFNSSEFNVLVQASQYYHFAGVILLAMGLVFQIPVAILLATRTGVVTTRQLRSNRRYAIGACAAVAALLPGDVVTMLLETVPLYLLFELSLLLARLFDWRARS